MVFKRPNTRARLILALIENGKQCVSVTIIASRESSRKRREDALRISQFSHALTRTEETASKNAIRFELSTERARDGGAGEVRVLRVGCVFYAWSTRSARDRSSLRVIFLYYARSFFFSCATRRAWLVVGRQLTSPRQKTREKMLENALAKFAGPNWQDALDLPSLDAPATPSKYSKSGAGSYRDDLPF